MEEKAKKTPVISRSGSPNLKNQSPSRNITGAATLKSKDSRNSVKDSFNLSPSKRNINDKHSTIFEANDSSISHVIK